MDWLSDNLWAGWLSAALVLGVVELLSLELIFLMLATGATVGMLTALVGLPFAVQAIAAAGASVAMLALVRPGLMRRLHAGPDLKHGHHRLIGSSAEVTAELAGTHPGLIALDGESWTAEPYDGQSVIAAGTRVEVLEIRGATAYVVPADTGLSGLEAPRSD